MTMPLFESKRDHCPACQAPVSRSGDLKPALTIRYWRDYPFEFDECNVCGCTFANPMPTGELLMRGSDALVRLYQRGVNFEQEFRSARQAYLRGRVFARKLRRISRTGSLLEIGCYDGFFLAGVRDHCDWEIEGVELAASPAIFAKERLGLRVHHGTLESLMDWGGLGRFDYVIATDLIERVIHPEAFFEAIARLVKPKAKVEIITPNARQDLAFAKRAHASGTPMAQVLNHVVYYSPRSLSRAFQNAGFRIRELYCYDIKHTIKDLGLLGRGKPNDVSPGVAFSDVESEPLVDLRNEWTEQNLQALRHHPKTGALYSIYRESLPKALRVKMPAAWELGHEIFCLAERV